MKKIELKMKHGVVCRYYQPALFKIAGNVAEIEDFVDVYCYRGVRRVAPSDTPLEEIKVKYPFLSKHEIWQVQNYLRNRLGGACSLCD